MICLQDPKPNPKFPRRRRLFQQRRRLFQQRRCLFPRKRRLFLRRMCQYPRRRVMFLWSKRLFLQRRVMFLRRNLMFLRRSRLFLRRKRVFARNMCVFPRRSSISTEKLRVCTEKRWPLWATVETPTTQATHPAPAYSHGNLSSRDNLVPSSLPTRLRLGGGFRGAKEVVRLPKRCRGLNSVETKSFLQRGVSYCRTRPWLQQDKGHLTINGAVLVTKNQVQ